MGYVLLGGFLLNSTTILFDNFEELMIIIGAKRDVICNYLNFVIIYVH